MQKEFVTYKIALKLKELGFDEPCFGFWNVSQINNSLQELKYGMCVFKNTSTELSKYPKNVLAPLWQQVIDWFREKHNIHISIPNYYDGWSIDIRGFKQNINLEYHSEPGICLENYYETREQAILKVIELCQKENI